MGVRKKGVRLFLCLVIVFVICLFPVVAVTGCHREPPTLTQYVGWLGSEAQKWSTVSPSLEITKPIDPSSMFPVMLHWGQETAVILAPLPCLHVPISLELSGWWSCFLFGCGLVVTPLRHGAAPLNMCVCRHGPGWRRGHLGLQLLSTSSWPSSMPAIWWAHSHCATSGDSAALPAQRGRNRKRLLSCFFCLWKYFCPVHDCFHEDDIYVKSFVWISVDFYFFQPF